MKEKRAESDSSSIVPKRHRRPGWTQGNSVCSWGKQACVNNPARGMKVLWCRSQSHSACERQELTSRLLVESNPAMETPTLILGGLCCSLLKYELAPLEAEGSLYSGIPLYKSIMLFKSTNISRNKCKPFMNLSSKFPVQKTSGNFVSLTLRAK